MDGAKFITDALEYESTGREVLTTSRSLILRSNGLCSDKDPGASKNNSGENPLRLKGKGFLAF